VETHDGLKAIDLTADPPRSVWSAFEGGDSSVMEHQRTASHLSAIVVHCRHGSSEIRDVERWTWELPSRRVIDRRTDTQTWGYMFTVAAPLRVSATTADGTLLYAQRRAGNLVECVTPIQRTETVRLLDDYAEFDVDGDYSALLQETATDAKVTLRDKERHAPVAVVTFPGARFACLRAHGDTATTYTGDGRIVAIDLQTCETLVNLRTT
jgi:hypothetical protein